MGHAGTRIKKNVLDRRRHANNSEKNETYVILFEMKIYEYYSPKRTSVVVKAELIKRNGAITLKEAE